MTAIKLPVCFNLGWGVCRSSSSGKSVDRTVSAMLSTLNLKCQRKQEATRLTFSLLSRRPVLREASPRAGALIYDFQKWVHQDGL